MNAYSLTAVLMSVVLLFGGLVPLLHVNGQLFEQARTSYGDALIQALEVDFQKISHLRFPQNKDWETANYLIKRHITRPAPNRYRVTYTCTLRTNPTKQHTIVREWLVDLS